MLPQRVVLAIMGFLGAAIVFAMRACFSIALTEMVMPIENTENQNTSTICSVNELSFAENRIHSQYIHNTGTKFNWTQAQQGWTLSSYYAGYAVGHIPAALLIQKFSAKWMLSLSVLIPCICSAATPFVLTYGRLDSLVAIRVLMGLFGGILFPAITTLLSAWVPSKERGTLGSIVFGGGQFGNTFAFYTSGLLLTLFTWPVVFYFWSILSIIWSISFMSLCYNSPESHPFVSKKERDYLRSEIRQAKRGCERSVPWKHMITSVPVCALVISQVGNDCLYATVFAHLPKYMKEVLGFTVHETGLYTSLASLSMWIATIAFGFLCDCLIRRRHLTTVQARKFFTALSGIIPPILLMVISYAECNRLAFVNLLMVATGFMGAYYSGIRVNTLDLAPNYAGALLAYANGIAANGSFIFPGIIGMIITDSTIEQWRTVFKISLALSLVRTTIYLIWASADVQPWNFPAKQESQEGYNLTNTKQNESANGSLD